MKRSKQTDLLSILESQEQAHIAADTKRAWASMAVGDHRMAECHLWHLVTAGAISDADYHFWTEGK